MVRIAIAEDDPAYLATLEEYLDRYRRENGLETEVTAFPDGLALTEGYRPVYDLLLDIEMPNLDGMSAAERIRAVDPAVVMIFITNMAQYAIKGYQVDALDYVLKPVSYAAFAFKLKKALAMVRRREGSDVVIHMAGGLRRMSADEIRYVEVVSHKLYLHTLDGVFSVPGTLRDMEVQLEEQHFVRCNKCYLVNLRHVREVRQNTVDVGGEQLLISRPRKKEFLQALTDYLGGGGI